MAVAGYNIYVNGTKVNSTLVTDLSYGMTGLTTGTTHDVEVRAVDDAGNESSTDATQVKSFLTKPGTVTGVSASAASDTQINLIWTATTGAASYKIERSTDNATWASLAVGITTASYSDTGLTASTTYYYRLKATNATGDSLNYSTVVSAATSAAALTKLATPTLNTPTVVSASQIDLSWADVANESQYELQSSTDNATFATIATLAANTISYSDTGLASGTTYYYRLRAIGDGTTYSNSDFSATVSATTQTATGPSWITGYPAITSLYSTKFDIEVQLNEPGTAYYVVLSDAATAPTSSEVKAGTGAGGAAAIKSGSVSVAAASTTYTMPVSGITEGTNYDVYIVAEDAATTPVLQASPTKKDVLTKPIVFKGSFSGTAIDTTKWTVTDPADDVHIGQNNRLEFTNNGTTTVNPGVNNIKTANGYNNPELVMSTYLEVAGGNNNQVFVALQVDENNRVFIARGATNRDNARILIVSAGTTVYDFESTIPLHAKRWKIRKDGSNNIVVEYWHATNAAWTQIGATQTVNIGTIFTPYYTMSTSNPAALSTAYMYDLVLTDYNYPLQSP